jgi:hypothetical protein
MLLTPSGEPKTIIRTFSRSIARGIAVGNTSVVAIPVIPSVPTKHWIVIFSP